MSGSINLNNYMSTKRFESTQMYQRPERIENEGLLVQRNFENAIGGADQQIGSLRGLRENLFEHYDFEALYPNIWLHLYSWYSADTQIARYLKQDTINDDGDMLAGSQTLKSALLNDMAHGNRKNLELDLYPSKLNDVILKNHSYFYDDDKGQKPSKQRKPDAAAAEKYLDLDAAQKLQ